MAIVEMSKITLLGMDQSRGKLLKLMQRMRCVHIAHNDEEALQKYIDHDHSRQEDISRRLTRIDWAIAQLAKYDNRKKSMFAQRPTMDEAAIESSKHYLGQGMEVVAQLEKFERTKADLTSEEAKIVSLLKQLQPWKDLAVPLGKLGDTGATRVQLQQIPNRGLQTYIQRLQQLSVPASLQLISQDAAQASVLVICHLSVSTEMAQLAGEFGANVIGFSEFKDRPDMEIDRLESRLKRIGEVREQLLNQQKDTATEIDKLRILRDVEAMRLSRRKADQQLLKTKSTFLLTGWIPTNIQESFAQRAKKIAPDCQIEFSLPDDDEKPPTLLHNRRGFAPFESIIGLYSLPDPRGLDPTAVMAPFFVSLFGMMVSDAGYGIVLALLAALYSWKVKPRGMVGQTAKVLIFGGIGTIFWGAMYGGWFAMEGIKPILLAPMESPLEMMILCLAAGAVHMLFGMGVAIYMNVKRGKWLDAVFDQGSWLVVFAGIGVLMVNQTVGLGLMALGALTIVLTAGRHKEANVFSKLLSGFGALYDISGYFGDVLSYIRLFGMGLATGVIGMVINTVATMLMRSPLGIIAGVLVLIGGHAFNLSINALGAYVHASRLQYIEFFGRFYESGGYAFSPLRPETKYVDIQMEDGL